MNNFLCSFVAHPLPSFKAVVICCALTALAGSPYCEANTLSTASSAEILSPWMKPRELSQFQTILKHSPFSLATAEETSPLAERYMITGVINIDGETEVFVFDRNDQSHDLVTKKPNAKSISLVDVLHQEDPSLLKATIRVNGETGVISNIDTSTNAASAKHPGMPVPGSIQRPGNQLRNGNIPYSPSMPSYPGSQQYGQPNQQNGAATNRLIIRRPPISPQQPNQANH